MERIVSTYDKAVNAKKSRGEVKFLSRESTINMDYKISHTLQKKRKYSKAYEYKKEEMQTL